MPEFVYDIPRPRLTVDLLLFDRLPCETSQILLVRRGEEPFKNLWCVPGGIVREREDVHTAALRKAKEELGLEFTALHATGVVLTDVCNDPRGWNVSVVFGGVCHPAETLHKGDSESDVAWFQVSLLPTDFVPGWDRALKALIARECQRKSYYDPAFSA